MIIYDVGTSALPAVWRVTPDVVLRARKFVTKITRSRSSQNTPCFIGKCPYWLGLIFILRWQSRIFFRIILILIEKLSQRLQFQYLTSWMWNNKRLTNLYIVTVALHSPIARHWRRISAGSMLAVVPITSVFRSVKLNYFSDVVALNGILTVNFNWKNWPDDFSAQIWNEW